MEETPRTDTPDAVEPQPPAPESTRPKAPEAEVFQGVQAAVAAVLVGVAALLVQFSAVHVPFHGSGDDLLCDTPAAHALLTAPEAFPMLPDAPLTVMGLAAAWQAGGGSAGTVRALGLLAHVLAAVGVFLLARRGRRPGSGEGVALGTALLFALSPAAAGALSTAPGLAPVLGAALAVWALLCLDRMCAGEGRLAPALAVILGAAACAADATAALFLVAALTASLPALRHRAGQLGVAALLAALCVTAGAAARLAAGAALPEALARAAGIAGADPALAAYYAWAVAALALAAVLGRLPLGAPRAALAAAAGVGALVLGVFSFLDLAARQNAEATLLAAAEAAPDRAETWASLARYCDRQTAAEGLTDEERAGGRAKALEAWTRAADTAPDVPEYRWHALRAGMPETPPDPAQIAALLLRAPRAPWAADAAALAASLRPAAADAPGAARAALDSMAYAARRAPNRADLQGARGLQLFMAGNMRQAAPLLAAATAALPEAPFAFAAEPAQKAAERVAALEKASREKLTANPADPAGHLARVEYELAAGHLTQALHLAASSRRRFPENTDVTRLLGLVRALRGEADLFLQEAADTLAPEAWEALTRQAAAANAWPAALRYAAKAPRAGGESPEEKLAETALALRRPDQAERLLRAALNADPAAWRPALRLADLARDTKQPEAAGAWIAEAQKRGAPEAELQQRGGAPAPQTFEPVRTMIQ